MEEQIYKQPRRNGKTWILVIAAVAVLLLCGVAVSYTHLGLYFSKREALPVGIVS